jgi:hypothetical protein
MMTAHLSPGYKYLIKYIFPMVFFVFPTSILSQRIQMENLVALEYIDHPLENVDHDHAFLDMTMLPGTDVDYLNVRIIDLLSGEMTWAIKNLPIPPLINAEPISYLVDLTDGGGNEGEKIIEWIVQYRETDFWIPESSVPIIPIYEQYRVPSGSGDPSVVSLISIPPIIIIPPLPEDVTIHYRGCAVPNIDLDSIAHNPTTTPGIPGDKLACGPAAAGNSLQWLVGQHPELDAIDDSSVRSKVDSLKKYMNKNDTIGVRFDSMVTGKLRLIDDLKLPIRVKYQTEHASGAGTSLPSADKRYGHVARNQTGPTNAPDWDWIKNEMDHGEDVELQYGVYGENANGDVVRAYGHWVVLTGYFDSDHAKGLWYKEDNDQYGPGGQRQRWVEWCVDENGFTFLKTVLGQDTLIGYVESVVSESYDPTVLFIDWSKFDWRFWPLLHVPGDIYDYPFHAFLVFERAIQFENILELPVLNARIFNPVSGLSTWAVRNVPLFPLNGNHAVFRMDLKDISDSSGVPAQIIMEVKVGDYEINSDFIEQGVLALTGQPFSHRIGGHTSDPHPPIPQFPISDVTLEEPDTIKYLNRSCEVPNIDLDSLKHPDATTGDINSCGPAATANSIKWLMNKHAEIMDVDSLRGILDTFELLMGKTYAGTKWDSMVIGKLAFIDQHKLPIRVKYQVHTPTADFKPVIPSPNPIYSHVAKNETPAGQFPSFEWICNELDEGEDVEMNFTYWCDSAGVMVQRTGHSVNVIGYAIIGNERWFYFKHDLDQLGPGGEVEEEARWRVDDSGYPFLEEFSFTPGCIAYVGSVISESYDPDVEFCPEKVCLPYDDGDGSLRRALICAEPGDTIRFGTVMNGQTIQLTSGPLIADKDVMILAEPSAGIQVSATSVLRALQVAENVEVKLIGFELQGGSATAGAGILTHGKLTLEDMQIINSQGSFVPSLIFVGQGQLNLEGQTNVRME